ncbi:hypothetical protein [Janthinobacterium sp. NKUCC06_STL]|uniref:hypothetical protein n=1 Tax=Janthinobacterium sp. NKUCC06_STL TaxID=2842127 RepID=UPI001C5AF462|nr:hypothetical protein [Janthinobacterium sp. NKUCC06_STL]MBW3512026.1 hypothetical protein [Janthinobacterium sp. NKUCC06_STL]
MPRTDNLSYSIRRLAGIQPDLDSFPTGKICIPVRRDTFFSMEALKMRFTFNKKAQRSALQALKHLETGSFASAVLGSFSASPRTTALVALGLFVVCRVCSTIIVGIEDTETKKAPAPSTVPEKPANNGEENETN